MVKHTPVRGGETFDPKLDGKRLSTQHAKVFETMRGGQWLTLQEIIAKAGLSVASQNGVSARLRDFRKPRFGSHTVDRRRVAGGVYQYRLTVRKPPQQGELFAAQEMHP